MKKLLLLFLIIGSLSFSKHKIECKPIYWKDMDKLDKILCLISKKYNGGKEPSIKQCIKINDKEVKNEKK